MKTFSRQEQTSNLNSTKDWLNDKDGSGRTAFHFACHNGLSNIAEKIIHKSKEYNKSF